MFAFPIIYEIVLQDHLHVHFLTFDVLRNNGEYATTKCLNRNIDSVSLSVYICHDLSVHVVNACLRNPVALDSKNAAILVSLKFFCSPYPFNRCRVVILVKICKSRFVLALFHIRINANNRSSQVTIAQCIFYD